MTMKPKNEPTDKTQLPTPVPEPPPKRRVPRFDLGKLDVQFCPAAQAELHCKEAVLDDLRRRAKSAGKRIWGGTESIVGPQRCNDVRWLYPRLKQMSHEFAAEVDEDLQKLSQPGADREALVGHIYTLVLCIRATNTIFFGDHLPRKKRAPKPQPGRNIADLRKRLARLTAQEKGGRS